MISKKLFFIILLITVFISFCKEQKDTIVIPVLHTEYSLILEDSTHTGLNIVKVDSKIAKFSFLILSNSDTVAYSKQENLIYFPYSNSDTFQFYVNGIQVLLPIKKQALNTLKSETDWIVLTEPSKAEYGIQSLTFLSFKKISGKWQNLSEPVYFQPWMNMSNGYGHSSQFNEQVQLIDSIGFNFQKGKVAFSMPGMWDLRFIQNADTLSTSIRVSAQKN